MAESVPAKVENPPAIAELQDPLPESDFTYRRAFSYAFVLILLFFIFWFTGTIGDVAMRGSESAIKGLVGVVRLFVYLTGVAVTYYMLAPSAEQLARIVQAGSMFRSGIPMRSTAEVNGARSELSVGPAAHPSPPPPPPPAPGATPVIE